MSTSSDLIRAKFVLAARFMGISSATVSSSFLGPSPSEPGNADPNVIGVAIGEKNSESGGSGVVGVRIFVKKKQPKSKLSSKQRIQPTIDGLPVDVVETGEFQALTGPVNPRTRLRPAPAGCSVGYDLGDGIKMAGTFGALVTDSDGKLYILSNNHVLAAEDRLGAGAAIFQPGLKDGGKVPGDQIAKLSKAVKLKTNGGNAVDAAIAEVLRKKDVSASIPVIGIPTGKRVPIRDIIVHKFGRTTEYTSGYITDTDAMVKVVYAKGTLTFDDQIVIRSLDSTQFSDRGDSGSLIVEKPTGKAVGLLFAGGTGYTLANPIQAVLKAFRAPKVQLVVQ